MEELIGNTSIWESDGIKSYSNSSRGGRNLSALPLSGITDVPGEVSSDLENK